METVTIDRVVETYIKIRDKRAELTREHEAKDKQLKFKMEELEMWLLAEANRQGVSGFKAAGIGTTFKKETIRATIADFGVFSAWVRENNTFEFFQARVGVNEVKSYMKTNGGSAPPGLNIFREIGMEIRRASTASTEEPLTTQEQVS